MAHPAWARVQAAVLDAIASGRAVAVLGRPGTGKTLLLQSVAAALAGQGRPARWLGHGDVPADVPKGEVLLVDEAGRLEDAELAALRRLPAVLAGVPSLEPRLAGMATLVLDPLPPEEVARYVALRLSETGRRRDLFEAEAVLALARHSEGLFRLAVVLAGASLFLAEQEGSAQVTKQHVDEAALMRQVVAEADEIDASAIEASAPAAAAEEPAVAMVQAEAPLARPSTRRPSRLRATRWVGFGLAGCGLMLGLVWAVSFRHGTRPPPMNLAQTGAPPVPVPAGGAPPQKAIAPVPAPAPRAPAVVAGPAPRSSPAPAAQPMPASDLAFRGPIMNDTMGQGGQLALSIRRSGPGGAVTAYFHASAGLIGTGELSGTMSPDGRVALAGRLMMGRNPFDCSLEASLAGDRLVGSASFVRASSGLTARSRFTLVRS